MKYVGLFLLVCTISTFSCKTKRVDYKDLNLYINDVSNGLKLTKELNDLKFSLTYKPSALLLYDKSINGNSNKQELQDYEAKLNKYYYFIFNISKNGEDPFLNKQGNFQEYSSSIQSLSFHLNEYIEISTSYKDTIALADFQTPSFFGMAKSLQLIFAMEKPNENFKAIKILINDFGLHTPRLEFIFKEEDILNLPLLISLDR